MVDGRRADDESLRRALEELPIFPLPSTVFFPHTLLPLHIFEPRYRQMTEAVIAGHQHLGVVLFEPPADDGLMKSPVAHTAAVAGLGKLVHHERLPDGRFHIMLQGVARVELLEELPAGDRLYRRVRARMLPAAPIDEDAVAREMTTLRGCYARLTESMPSCKDTLGDLPMRIHDPCVISDVIAAATLEDVALRQRALEETNVARRLSMANEALATLLLKSLAWEGAGMH